MKFRNLFIIPMTLLALISACDEPNTKDNTVIEEPKEVTSITKELDDLITKDPNDSKLYYQRARYYFDTKNYPKALIDILTSLNLNKKDVAAYLLGGDIYLAMNQGNDAVDLMSEAINNNPKNEALYTRAVEYNFYMKNEQAALNFANDLLRINKNNADAYFFKGLIFKETDLNKAISSFQTCVEQDPTYYNAYMQLGTILSKKKDNTAIKYFDNAIRIQPGSREALYGKGYHYQEAKQYNKAKAQYKKMIITNKRDFQALYNMGHCFLAQDTLDRAATHFDMAINVKPDYVDAIFMQGQIAERTGDIVNAKIHYQNALKLLPGNETIQEALDQIK